jgi:hypothetical protein
MKKKEVELKKVIPQRPSRLNEISRTANTSIDGYVSAHQQIVAHLSGNTW